MKILWGDYRLLALAAVLVLVLVVAGLVFWPRSVEPEEAPNQDLLIQGDAHAARMERAAAIAAYEEAARLSPDDPLPYLRMARVYLDWGRADEALVALAEAERLGAEAEALGRLRVEAFTARADWSAVTEHAQQLLALVPEDREAAHALARAYVELRAWAAARAEYEALLRVAPDDALAHERLGIMLLSDDPTALQHLYAARTDLANRMLVALQDMGTADDPAYARTFLGRVLIEEEEWALAVYFLDQAVLLNPEYADARAYLGHALDQMGYPDEAQPHLLWAVELAPDSVVTRTLLGVHYERLGDHAAARAEYEKAYDLDPANPATCVAVGQTWIAEGRYEVAELWFQEAVYLQPDEPLYWEILTRFYLEHNIVVLGKGVASAEELVSLSPDDARAHDLRGWAALQVGDYATAEESLTRALSLDPSLAVAYYHLGLLRRAQGDWAGAQAAFTRAKDLDTTGDLTPLIEREVGE